MTAIASRNPFDLLSDDGEPASGAMTVAPVKKKGAASLAAPAVDISSSSKTSAAAAQIKGGNARNSKDSTKPHSSSNYNSSSQQSSRDQKGGENRSRAARPDGERRPYVQRGPGPASGEGALYEKFPKGTGSHKNDAANGAAARGPRAGRGGRANNDRHSKDGRRDNEKRHGGGAANWGNEEQDAHKVEHLDGNNATEALKEIVEGEAGLDANGDTTTPAGEEEAKEEDETPQLTLEEYRAQMAAQELAVSKQPRAVDQAEALKGFVPVERKNEEDFYVGKTEKAKKEKKEAKAKQVLLIEQKFNEAPRPPRGEGGDRRGSRGGSNSNGGSRGGSGGASRGGSFGGRGGGRGGNSASRGGRAGPSAKSTAQAADLNDDKLFPSLQR